MSKGNDSTKVETMFFPDDINNSFSESAISDINQEFKRNRCSEWVKIQSEIKDEYEEIKDESEKILLNNAIKMDSVKRKRPRVSCLSGNAKKKSYTIQEIELTLECEWKQCHFITDDYNKFQLHVKYHIPELAIRQTENKSEVYVCLWDLCNYETDDSDLITKHVNFHSYHSKLKAVGYNVRELNNLPRCAYDSANRNTIPENLSYSCAWDDCINKFQSPQEYYDHIKCHVIASQSNNKSDTNFYCGWIGCKVKRARCIHLAEHSRAHTGEKLVACVHCGTMFASNTKFADHCYRQLPIEVCLKENFLCTNCSKVFPSNRLLRDHMRLHINNYKCSLCDMTCTTPSALAKHIRYRHVDDRVFQCNMCSHACVTKRDLQLHLSTHDSSKKFACDFEGCDFRCRSMVGLTKHALMHRQQINNENTYASEHNVDNDSENEDDQTRLPYCCHCCEESFTHGSKLTKHLINKHGFHWPPGHSRFTYRIESDGYFRLQTTRYENVEISDHILNTVTSNEFLKSMNHSYEIKIETPLKISDLTNIIIKTTDEPKACTSNYKSKNIKKSTEKRKTYKTKNNCDLLKSDTECLIEDESNQTDSNLGSIEDFSVMKRYITDNKNIIITLDDVNEKGQVIKTQTFNNND